MLKNAVVAALISGAVVFVGPAAHAAGSGSSSYQQPAKSDVTASAQKALAQSDYQAALAHLEKAMLKEPNNADVHNLMGFSLRKLGRYADAGISYEKALSLDPQHRGALEYQGELFLTLGQLDRAQANLDRLDTICTYGCEEYTLLKDAIARYTATN